MSRLVRRIFSRILDVPRRPTLKVYRAADLRARLMVQALEGRAVPATFTVLNAADAGAGSLRQAITDANNAAGADTVAFDATFFATPRTITLTTGQLTVSGPTTITGPGASRLTVSGNNASRVFNITDGLTTTVIPVTLSGLTVSGGSVNTGDGAGLFIANENVTVLDAVISGNTIPGTNQTLGGAGIGAAANATLTVRNTTLSGNTASGPGAAISFYSGGSLLLENSTLSGNTSTLGANGAGGIYFYGTPSAAGFTIRNSTISGNRAPSGGGLGFVALGGNVLIQNSTITGNTATSSGATPGLAGGGITKVSGAGTVTLISSIVAGNTTSSTNASFADISLGGAGPVVAVNSAIGVDPGASVLSSASANNLPFGANLNLQTLANNGGPTLTHALGAGSAAINRGKNPAGIATDQRGANFIRTALQADIGAFEVQPAAGIPNAFGSFPDVTTAGATSYTFQVTYTDDTAIDITRLGTGDIRVTGPGGFTQLATFVSVDNTNPGAPRATYSFTPPGSSWDLPDSGTYTIALEANQVADTSNNFVPAGSIETFVATLPQTFTVTNASDSGPGSLRQAILDATNRVGTTDNIVFDAAFFSTARTINLTSGELLIAESVNITGPGAGLLTVRRSATATPQFRVFNVNGSGTVDATIAGLTVTGGSGAAIGGGILFGAADDLTLLNAVVTGNTTASPGGGIAAAPNAGLLTVRNSTISGNTGAVGGGIYFTANGALLIENSTISGNTAAGEGGGIYFYGTVTPAGLMVRNSTISGNTAGTNGGGIALNTVVGTLLVQNSTITANIAQSAGTGGGLAQSSGNTATITVVSSIVAGNTNAAAPDIRSTGTVNVNFSAVGSSTGFTPSGSSGNNLAAGALLNLQPLASNGGPTLTHALGTGSAAIDTGNNPANFATDQRGTGFIRAFGLTDIGAFELQPAGSATLRVAATQINGGAAQRSMVTSLSVTFSAVVTFATTPGLAFTLTRVGGGAVTFTATAATVGNVTVVTLNNFTGTEASAGSLVDGRYLLTALADQITANGQRLDGNADGNPGDNFTFTDAQGLFRLFGDSNGDRRVDNADFFQFRTTFGLSSNNPAFLAFFDVNGDGLVDNADFFQFRTRFGTGI